VVQLFRLRERGLLPYHPNDLFDPPESSAVRKPNYANTSSDGEVRRCATFPLTVLRRGVTICAMRGGLSIVVVVATVITLSLAGAVGVSAHSGTFGSSHATAGVEKLVSEHINLGDFNLDALKSAFHSNDKDKETGQCHPPKKVHKNGTPGHKNHPCGEDDGSD
jgi:hypothetical protein